VSIIGGEIEIREEPGKILGRSRQGLIVLTGEEVVETKLI
jgi:hypothetical protein